VAILQALISLLSRSASKALNAIFGWAVLALFGQRSAREQTLLSALVAAAAAWPLLLLGVFVPRIALMVVAFVPLAKEAGPYLRVLWIALALVVPLAVGIAVANLTSSDRLPEPAWKKLLRGFPITLALAGSFLLMIVVAPVLHIAALIRRHEVVRIPALMDRNHTAETMAALADALAARGIPLRRAEAPWSMTAPSKIMLKLGGAAFASMANEHVEYRCSDVLSLAVLANETVLRGKSEVVGLARALSAEVYAPRPILTTFNPEARAIESQLKRVWSIYLEQPRAHRHSDILERRLAELTADLSRQNLPWEEWQIIYRLLLQFDRALRGHAQLLGESTLHEENDMAESKEKPALPGPRNATRLPGAPTLAEAVPIPLEGMSNRELITHVIDNARLLARKEIALAKAELKQDLRTELSMVKGLGIGAICALCTLNLMLVSVALALGHVMPEWAAALVVAAVVLLIGTVAGVVGWSKRVKNPLESTRRSLKEDALWAKERLA
jgi:uncharacterized membrane protein YqjE